MSKLKPYDARTLLYVARRLRQSAKNMNDGSEWGRPRSGVCIGQARNFEQEARALTKKKRKGAGEK